MAKRKCNVVTTGLPENSRCGPEEDAIMFTKFCEENLSVKSVLARRGCRRLGKHTDQRPRKLLIHLTSETSATSLLSASRNFHRNEATKGYYINPDLSPAELKLAFEQRQRRRSARHENNLTSAGVSDTTAGVAAGAGASNNDNNSMSVNTTNVGPHCSNLAPPSGAPPPLHPNADNVSSLPPTHNPFH